MKQNTLHQVDKKNNEKKQYPSVDETRRQLLDVYNRSHPFEKAIVQLCSVIYEPVKKTVFTRCMRRAGISPPDKKITENGILDSSLNRLRKAALINEDFQCHELILEEVSREALTKKLQFKLGDYIKEIEDPSCWSSRGPLKTFCFICRKSTNEPVFQTKMGEICISCLEPELWNVLSKNDISEWQPFLFLDILSPAGRLCPRLNVLWQFENVEAIMAKKNPSKVQELLEMLVRNLGHITPHPLDFVVRNTAFKICQNKKEQILPILFMLYNPEPFELYINIIKLAYQIDPEHPEVEAMVDRASRDVRPEVRHQVATLFAGQKPRWAQKIHMMLGKDTDPLVREAAKNTKYVKALEKKLEKSKYHIPLSGGFFGLMARAVWEELPFDRDQLPGSQSKKHCYRFMRDFRVSLYCGMHELMQTCYEQIISRCDHTFRTPDPFVRVMNNPFDKTWFRSLPQKVQSLSLIHIFSDAILCGISDCEALEYALNERFLDTVPESGKEDFLYHLIWRLIMNGKLELVKKHFISTFRSNYKRGNIEAWIAFVEGRISESFNQFDNRIKELKDKTDEKEIFFSGMNGIFYFLSLLPQGNGFLDERIAEHLERNASDKSDPSFQPCYQYLNAVLHMQNCQPGKARTILSDDRIRKNNLSTFLHAFATFWIDNRLNEHQIQGLEEIIHQAMAIDLKWLVLECSELICRADPGYEKTYRQLSDHIQQETGMKSLFTTIQIEEPWEKGLQALACINEAIQEQEVPKEMRLIWLIDIENGSVMLQAREQKRTASGAWTRGRPVAFSRLYSKNNLEYMTPQDHKLCDTVEREAGGNQGMTYYFNIEKSLPNLVGHPFVFLASSPEVSVEVFEGEPELRVTRIGKRFNLSFYPEISENRVSIVRETPTRFKVIEITDEHLAIAKTLGNQGLNIPIHAKKRVQEAIARISSLVTIHSDIEGISKDCEEVPSNSTVIVQMIPAGTGIRLEVFVKPFGEGGPYLKPGIGAEIVAATIQGKRYQTHRDLALETQNARIIENACPTLSMIPEYDRQWILNDPQDCLQVLLDLKELQQDKNVVVEWPEGEKFKVTRQVSLENLSLTITKKTDWFEINGQLLLDNNQVLDMKVLLELLNNSPPRFIPISDRQFLALTRELRKRLEDLNAYSEIRGDQIRLHPLAAVAIPDFTDGILDLEADHEWNNRLNRMQESLDVMPVLPSTLKAELRSYQIEGYQWLARLSQWGVGACLADDMGLGKTLQATALILNRAPGGPTMVVAPTSVCMNWIAEANRFAPTLNMIQFGGKNREQLVKNLKALDVLTCSYGLLLQEAELLKSIEWHTVVLDEAQAIKNFSTKRSQAAMNLKSRFKLITTGTPIENHLGELWTLFNFINPGLLGSWRQFNERFAVPIERDNDINARKRLRKLIKPFILRRIKTQVLEELPPRTEIMLQVEMNPEETAFYEALRQTALENLEKDANLPPGHKHIKILAEIMRLRQACCNPRLVAPNCGITSSKLELFGQVVSELIENRHKALVFSQFVGHLKLIREYLDKQKIHYRYLDGSTPIKERQKEIDAFQKGEGDAFLISLKAGGLGLNLTAATYVIHMDPWWNPAVEDQASDRAHRIGQLHPVTVYRLVMSNTIEEKIVKLHREKRELADSLLDGTDISGKVTTDELLKLIRET